MNIEITGKEAGFNVALEYNRSFLWGWNSSIFGAVELNNRYTVKSGLALGMVAGEIEIRAFGSGRYALFQNFPLFFNLAYVYHGLPGQSFNMHAHSIKPFLSLSGRRAGISIGNNFRFTRFFGEISVFESVLAVSVSLNFINNTQRNLNISAGNFGNFHAANIGAYSFKLEHLICLENQWVFAGNAEIFQRGGDLLTSTFYGFSAVTGLRFGW